MRLLQNPPRDHLAGRLLMLLTGLLLYGFSNGLLVLAGLGLDPWDVLHQGLARTFGGAVGSWSIAVGAVVLLGWVPLRQRPGIGTICNVILIGLTLNATLWLLPPPTVWPGNAW